MANNKVVFIQYRLTHYREAFLDKVKKSLSEFDIDFSFVHCKSDSDSISKKDEGYLPWARIVKPIVLRIFGVKLIWIPVPRDLRDSDLIIITQENKLVANYYWLFLRFFKKFRLAFFGHGRNYQSRRPEGLKEAWKRVFAKNVDWWFAYTDSSKQYLENIGYPINRLSVLNNAIDNDLFVSDLKSVSDSDVLEFRQRLLDSESGVEPFVGLFCGSLYPDKNIDFMIKSADLVHDLLPNFVLLVAGGGPSYGEVIKAASTRPWLHVLGVKKGLDKAALFKSCDLIFNPGAVGLHVLDAFAAGKPMITTSSAKHGPEAAYLRHRVNGLVIDGGVREYADAVICLAQDKSLYESICYEADLDSKKYTLDLMVENFVSGIKSCLISQKK